MPSNLDRLRSIALALPETHEELTWGSDITFRVRTKIFCTPGDGTSFAVKVPTEQLVALLDDPRFQLAPYWGRFGWVRVRLERPIDWDEVAALVRGSYRLIAPKALAKLVDWQPALRRATRRSHPARDTGGRRPVASGRPG